MNAADEINWAEPRLGGRVDGWKPRRLVLEEGRAPLPDSLLIHLVSALSTLPCPPYACRTSQYVLLDLESCKGSEISWFCCQGGSCTPQTCDPSGTLDAGKDKCDEVTSSTVQVEIGTTSVTLQGNSGSST
jgi:hypothetical protein